VTDFEFITIDQAGVSPSGKTCAWTVRSKRSGLVLGGIRWWGAWRQYVFFPEVHTLYSAGCLRDVAAFLAANRDTRPAMDDGLRRRVRLAVAG
jgi:hypothetical protein